MAQRPWGVQVSGQATGQPVVPTSPQQLQAQGQFLYHQVPGQPPILVQGQPGGPSHQQQVVYHQTPGQPAHGHPQPQVTFHQVPAQGVPHQGIAHGQPQQPVYYHHPQVIGQAAAQVAVQQAQHGQIHYHQQQPAVASPQAAIQPQQVVPQAVHSPIAVHQQQPLGYQQLQQPLVSPQLEVASPSRAASQLFHKQQQPANTPDQSASLAWKAEAAAVASSLGAAQQQQQQLPPQPSTSAVPGLGPPTSCAADAGKQQNPRDEATGLDLVPPKTEGGGQESWTVRPASADPKMPGSTTANGTAEQGELATVKVEGTAGKEGAAEAALDPGKEDEKAKEKPKQKKKRPAPQVAVSPEEAARILPKAELQKLLTLLLGEGSTMEPDLEDAMLKEVEGFLEAALISGCSMARRRKSDTLEPRDIAICLERQFHMHIPGYTAGEHIRPYRRPAASEIHKERHAAVRRSRIQDTAQQEKQQQITAAAAASLALLPEEKELGEASTKKQKT